MTGIYIHIPFCMRKCPYCDFYSVVADDEVKERYVSSLCRNISFYGGKNISADTIYFGGGTPSLLSPSQVERILSACNSNFRLCSPEITIEANPSSVNYEKLSAYRKLGVNRISFGIQSAVDSELEFLGRLHNFRQAEKAVENTVKSGFDNISCDLMTGLAEQDMESLEYSLKKFLQMPLKHISAYMLKIEKGTAFDCEKIKKSVAGEDLVCDMYLKTSEILGEAGFEHYEISNFAKDKAYSRHNLKYWRGEEYIGFGPGAHSFYGGTRYCCPKNIGSFINDEKQTEIILEKKPDKTEEYIMLGLRLKWGIELKKVCDMGGKDFSDKILSKALIFEKNGFCKVLDENISLTPKGFLVSNEIISEFLDCRN